MISLTLNLKTRGIYLLVLSRESGKMIPTYPYLRCGTDVLVITLILALNRGKLI